jgi:hypothetical protein
MKRTMMLAGVFGVALVLGLMTMGCKTIPRSNELSFWQAADKSDLQKMEKAWKKADQKTKNSILRDILHDGGTTVWTYDFIGIFQLSEERIQLTEANVVPVFRFFLNNGVGINDPIEFIDDNSNDYRSYRAVTKTTPLNRVIEGYKKWPQPLGYQAVTFLLENGADPNIRWTEGRSESGYGSGRNTFSWGTPLAYAKNAEDDKLIALLIAHGAKDVEPLSGYSSNEYTYEYRSPNLPSPATPTTPSTAVAAPALRDGTYRRSDIRGHELVLISSPFKQVTYKIDGRSEAQGSFQINGAVLIIEYSFFFGDSELRNQLQGEKLVYTITSDMTFSGNGQSWAR